MMKAEKEEKAAATAAAAAAGGTMESEVEKKTPATTKHSRKSDAEERQQHKKRFERLQHEILTQTEVNNTLKDQIATAQYTISRLRLERAVLAEKLASLGGAL